MKTDTECKVNMITSENWMLWIVGDEASSNLISRNSHFMLPKSCSPLSFTISDPIDLWKHL